MSLNVSALRQTDTITNDVTRSTFPYAIEALEDDEWIKIRKIRNAIDDLDAWTKAAVPIAPTTDGIKDGDTLSPGQEDPDVAEVERRAKDVIDSQFEVKEVDRYRYIWHYMFLDCFVHDGLTEEDKAAGKTRGRLLDKNNYQDVDDIFTLIGDDLVVILQGKGGGVPVKAVSNPKTGEPEGFRDTNKVGDTKPTSETTDTTDRVLGEDGTGPTRDEVVISDTQADAT